MVGPPSASLGKLSMRGCCHESHSDSAGVPTPGQINSLSVLGARLTWVCIGPAALLFTTIGIIANGTGWLAGLDLFFGVVVGLMVLGRSVDHRSGLSLTLSGEPATDAQSRRYTTIAPPLAAGVWIVANTLGNPVLA